MKILDYVKTLKKFNTFSDVISYNSTKYPNKIFIEDDKIKINYHQFNHLVDCCCNYFFEKKLKKNDVVSLLLANSIDYLIVYFASIRFGTIINPIPISSVNQNINIHLKTIKPKIIFYDNNFSDLNTQFNQHFIKKKNNLYSFLKKNYSKIKNNQNQFINKKKDIACYYLSSGTTSNSKIIKYSHASMINGQIALLRSGFSNKQNPRHLCFLPFGHTSVLRYSIKHCLVTAGSIIICDNYWSIKNSLWKIVFKKNINYFQTVPTILNSIFLLGKSKKFCKNKIKFIGCGSAILDKKDHVNFEKKFGIKVSNLYGLSETGATHFDNPFLKNRVPGSIGKPLKGVKCKLLINKKISSVKNQSGQILIKSNFLMNGYLGKRKINQNNFFKTGDLGKFDKNNNLIFVDRRKDIIVKGGVNIMPSEIEEVIKEINHIVDVAVIGIKDEFFGENLVGHIVSQKSNPDLKQILQYCEKKLGLFKTPIDLIIHKQLPKTASGKILKRHLK
tara:strand:- start:7664 stop:9169 length:1506 start_codon:yes stop_codon:yes gene_type:complete